MIPDNVTLVVKAPNQQIEDQNIECRSSWTVRELKGHLSEVYPSKPRTEEQKLIYSGRLLEDNTILKDVLRSYECQLVHTMHLVCTPNRKMPETQPPKEDTTDGLRRRNVNAERNEARPEMRQNDQNHTVEMQNYFSSIVNNYGRVPPYPNYNISGGYLPGTNDPATYANQMAMMQQAYMQYMQQYANLWQVPNTTQPAPAPVPEAPPQPAAEAPPQVEEGEDGLGARDWLDNIYAASRLGILFSLVYLYGSPARLLLVIVLVAAGYLYQIGFFRDLQVNQNNVQNDNRPNVANQPQNPGNQAQNPGDRQQSQATDSEQVPPAAPREDESILGVTRMIFTTFFASLIPDVN